MSASGPNVVIWPCSKIPYEMSDTHPAKKEILDAMKEVEGKTPISFSVRINEPNYINIICDEEKSNKSPVGMHAGERKVNIKSDAWWALHELCHTAGLIHEQARKDRNSFIYVYDPSDGNNVIVAETIYYSAYDRESVMQYASDMAGGMYWLADPKLKLGPEDRRVLGANDATGLNARYSGNSGWQRTSQVLASSTDGAPSLCGVGDTLYALWKGDNDGIYYSSNDQPKVGDWTLPSRIEGAATKMGPAALQLDGNLAVFWNDSETNWVCYSVLRAGAWDPRTIIPGARSDVPPAAANFAGKLWVMFTPPKGTGVYYMTYDTASQRWSLPERLPGTATKDAPSLAVYDGRLYVAWRGHEDDGIYYAATDGGAWTDSARMPQSGTATSVALTTYRDPYDGAERLYAVWFGAGKDGLWWAYFDGYSWCGQANMKPGVLVLNGPSLTRQGERIYCSWQSVGSRVFVNEFLIPA